MTSQAERPLHCENLMVKAGRTRSKNSSQIWKCNICGLRTTFKSIGRPSDNPVRDARSMKVYQHEYYKQTKWLKEYKKQYLQ